MPDQHLELASIDQLETDAWNRASQLGHEDAYRDFLQRYPGSLRAGAARMRFAKLRGVSLAEVDAELAKPALGPPQPDRHVPGRDRFSVIRPNSRFNDEILFSVPARSRRRVIAEKIGLLVFGIVMAVLYGLAITELPNGSITSSMVGSTLVLGVPAAIALTILLFDLVRRLRTSDHDRDRTLYLTRQVLSYYDCYRHRRTTIALKAIRKLDLVSRRGRQQLRLFRADGSCEPVPRLYRAHMKKLHDFLVSDPRLSLALAIPGGDPADARSLAGASPVASRRWRSRLAGAAVLAVVAVGVGLGLMMMPQSLTSKVRLDDTAPVRKGLHLFNLSGPTSVAGLEMYLRGLPARDEKLHPATRCRPQGNGFSCSLTQLGLTRYQIFDQTGQMLASGLNDVLPARLKPEAIGSAQLELIYHRPVIAGYATDFAINLDSETGLDLFLDGHRCSAPPSDPTGFTCTPTRQGTVAYQIRRSDSGSILAAGTVDVVDPGTAGPPRCHQVIANPDRFPRGLTRCRPVCQTGACS